MSNIFHPYPLIAGLKSTIVAVIAILLVMFIRGYMPILPSWIELAIIGVLLLDFIILTLHAYTRTVRLDDAALVYTCGIISQHSTSLPYSKITESSFNQNILERFFAVGTLRVDTPGGTGVAVILTNMRKADVKCILDKINSANKL